MMAARERQFFDALKHRLRTAPPQTMEAPGVNLKEAAVLAPIYWENDEPWVMLTARPLTMRKHPGQLSFPGGGKEVADLTPLHTALRETHEELGIDPAAVDVLGMLGAMPTITSFWVTPFVGAVAPDVTLNLNTNEIAELVRAPLWRLRSEKRVFYGAPRDALVWDDARHAVWGVTHRLMIELLRHVDALR